MPSLNEEKIDRQDAYDAVLKQLRTDIERVVAKVGLDFFPFDDNGTLTNPHRSLEHIISRESIQLGGARLRLKTLLAQRESAETILRSIQKDLRLTDEQEQGYALYDAQRLGNLLERIGIPRADSQNMDKFMLICLEAAIWETFAIIDIAINKHDRYSELLAIESLPVEVDPNGDIQSVYQQATNDLSKSFGERVRKHVSLVPVVPEEQQDCTNSSFLMAMLAHPVTRIVGVVTLIAGLALLGLFTFGPLPAAVVLGAGFTAAMYTRNRWTGVPTNKLAESLREECYAEDNPQAASNARTGWF